MKPGALRLWVNGEPRELDGGLTVEALLEHEREPAAHVLVEVNGVLVPPRRHAQHLLVEGDRVEIILSASGG
jgi:sulfur carrier protein